MICNHYSIGTIRCYGRFQINLDEGYVRNSYEDLLKTGSRNEQYRMHKRFEKYSSIEEARQNCPLSLSEDNWNQFCNRFTDPLYQNRCAINKTNRSKQTITHNRGSRAFVAERYYLRDEVTGVEPDIIDFYKSTHWDKMKGWTCEGAVLNHGEMERLRSLVDSDGNPMMTPDEIVDHVLGTKSGYIRGLGHGPKPKTARYSQYRAENQALVDRIKALEAARVTEAEAEAHCAEKEAMSAREAKFDKLFDMLSASGLLPPIFFFLHQSGSMGAENATIR